MHSAEERPTFTELVEGFDQKLAEKALEVGDHSALPFCRLTVTDFSPCSNWICVITAKTVFSPPARMHDYR